MKYILIVSIFLSFFGCTQEKRPLQGKTQWQKQMNADFKDATTSPLKDKDRKRFRGLVFFEEDSTYIVKAKLKRTPKEKPFKMKTTTSRLPNYVKYGVISFELKDKNHELDIFRNLDLVEKDEKYKDYLFLPFLDETNGEITYVGGRYVEAFIPKSDTIIINFNEAYNPYCAYNEKYSCPIVPRQNFLNIKVEAGVKVYKK